MARFVKEREGTFVSATLHLTNNDVVKICDASSPSAALVSLALTAADGGLSGPVVQAIAAVVTWRLKSKNAEFGHQGLSISFKYGGHSYLPIVLEVGLIATTLRIKPPEG